MEKIVITSFRKDPYKLMEKVIKFNEPITVTTKNGNAVIMSEQDYDSLQETIYLLSQLGLLESIQKGVKEDPTKMKEFDPDEKW